MSSVDRACPRDPHLECMQETCPYDGSPEGRPEFELKPEYIKELVKREDDSVVVWVQLPRIENCKSEVCGTAFNPTTFRSEEALTWLEQNVDGVLVSDATVEAQSPVSSLLAWRALKSA